MFDQTPLNQLKVEDWAHQSSFEDPPHNDGGRVRQLMADVTELVELQARLVADDVRMTLASVTKPSIFVILGSALLVGTIPVFLLGAANVLVDQWQWSPHMAQLTCSGLALIIAMVMVSLALWKLMRCATPLQRSLDEFEKNLDTLREMLTGRNAFSDNPTSRRH